MSNGFSGLQIRSLVTPAGRVEVSLARVETPPPGPGEVVVRMEAAPINPSDLGLLLGPADMATLAVGGTGEAAVLSAAIPDAAMPLLAPRVGESMPVGNEGAGTVVAAGAGAEALMGKLVTLFGGATYAQYRTAKAAEVMVLPAGASAADGASCFVNPLTALGMTETMKLEGHTALVHTAAASNLGQMLNRICLKDGIALVNVVRSPAQKALLEGQGAKIVVDTSSDRFIDELTEAVDATGATLGFDATGGGPLAGQILTAIETAVNRKATTYSRYGSSVHKQVYIYGSLDTRPTTFVRRFGLAWGMGGWLLMPFLARIGEAAAGRLRQRVMDELKTTFASHYTAEIGLTELLHPTVAAEYGKRATGRKFLINPAK
jgi:NADPH:quinone reductase-like Zn-dependent oxidoreductase